MLWFSVFAVVLMVASGARVQNRIVGGEDAMIDHFPYQVSVQAYNQHICGGSIVSRRQIVTAAHCTDGISEPMKIRAGSSYHNVGGQVIKVVHINQHTAFDSKTYNYDVSVLTLEYDLEYDTGVLPIPLTRSEPLSGWTTVSGWGHTSEDGAISTHLKKVQLPIVARSVCARVYGDRLTENMICAGYGIGGRDACQGDSGGPLAMDGKLVGIVSWGIGCARPNLPGIYTNVAKVLSQNFALVEFIS